MRADLTALAPDCWPREQEPTRSFCFFDVQVEVLSLWVGSDGRISRVGLRRRISDGRGKDGLSRRSIPKGRIGASRNRTRCARCDLSWSAKFHGLGNKGCTHQKTWSFVVLSLKLQKSVPMTLHTRSSEAMVCRPGCARYREKCRALRVLEDGGRRGSVCGRDRNSKSCRASSGRWA